MANGFEISINEIDFRAKPQSEQNWILFQGIMAANKGISIIDNEGCEFARKRNRYWTLKVLSAISGGAVFGLGIVYIIYQMVFK